MHCEIGEKTEENGKGLEEK